MRRLIAASKISLDGKIEGPDGYADWVESWAEEYGLATHIDACILGGRMYPGYEAYWTAVQRSNATGDALPMTGKAPTNGEIAWASFASTTPHYVLTASKRSPDWVHTHYLGSLQDIAALKRSPGRDIYLMGGAEIIGSCLDAGLLDEIRLIVYPLIVGAGKPLFGTTSRRHQLHLRGQELLGNGRYCLIYGTAPEAE